jgi:16S rRNA (guanine527-N7)-methyltransferase
VSALLEGARAFGLALDEAQVRMFVQYQVELFTWNQKFNLTHISEPAEVTSRHFLDSLSFFSLVVFGNAEPFAPASPVPHAGLASTPRSYTETAALGLPLGNAPSVVSVIDIGAGAGFPAIPLKIVRPAWHLTLLEATRKKCDFLEHIVDTLHLDHTRVVWSRAETAAHLAGEREQYDLVVARAVAELSVLAEYMLPFARVGGGCVAWKGDAIEAEVNAAGGAIAQLGGRLQTVRQVRVPGIDQKRHLVVLDKVAPTAKIYPRREGIPAKKPLR